MSRALAFECLKDQDCMDCPGPCPEALDFHPDALAILADAGDDFDNPDEGLPEEGPAETAEEDFRILIPVSFDADDFQLP